MNLKVAELILLWCEIKQYYWDDLNIKINPIGLSFLSSVCSLVNIPVYAIGGISISNAQKAINAGADGICIMSGLMNCKDPRGFI